LEWTKWCGRFEPIDKSIETDVAPSL